MIFLKKSIRYYIKISVYYFSLILTKTKSFRDIKLKLFIIDNFKNDKAFVDHLCNTEKILCDGDGLCLNFIFK